LAQNVLAALEQIEETAALEDAAHEGFQFERVPRRVADAVDRAPDFEPFLVRGQRADPRLQAVAHHERGVVLQ
jgi:hypothetical protein